MPADGEEVASYASADEAAAATGRLIEHGVDEADLSIRPGTFAPVERPGLIARASRTSRVGAATLGTAFLGLGTVARVGLGDAIGLVVLGGAGAIAGGLVGAIVGAIRHRDAALPGLHRGPRFRPERFDVVVAGDATEAALVLDEPTTAAGP